MKCPKCNYQNDRKNKKCTVCGAELKRTFTESFSYYNKKYKLNIILVVSVIAIIIAFSAILTSLSVPNKEPIPNIASITFENQEISFKYPENWDILPNQTQNMVIAFGDPTSKNNTTGTPNTYITVLKEQLPSGQNLKDTFNVTYSKLKTIDSSYQNLSNQVITIDGRTAYENVYYKNISNVKKQERAVWVEKNGVVYIITLSTLPGEFDKNQDNFNLVSNSFHIK